MEAYPQLKAIFNDSCLSQAENQSNNNKKTQPAHGSIIILKIIDKRNELEMGCCSRLTGWPQASARARALPWGTTATEAQRLSPDPGAYCDWQIKWWETEVGGQKTHRMQIDPGSGPTWSEEEGLWGVCQQRSDLTDAFKGSLQFPSFLRNTFGCSP